MMTTSTSHQETPASHGSGEHSRPSYDDINTSVIFMVGICAAIITVLIISLVEGLTYHWQASVGRDRLAGAGQEALQQMIDDQRAELAVSDGDSRLSIDEAIRRVIERFGSGGSGEAGAEASQTAGDSN